MDCAFAEERPGTYGEWIWFRRAAAPVRLIRAGRECLFFQAPGTVNDHSLAARQIRRPIRREANGARSTAQKAD
jgi:hypothetical protein